MISTQPATLTKTDPLNGLAEEIRRLNSNFDGDEFYNLVNQVVKLAQNGLNPEIEQLLQNLLAKENLQVVHGFLTALKFQQFNRKSAKEHYVLVAQAFPQPGDFWKDFIGTLILAEMNRALRMH